MTQRDELERGLHRFRTDVVLRARPRTCLLDGLAGEDTKRDRNWQGCRELGERSRDGVGEHVEMGCLPPDQTAERHDRVETLRACEHRDRRWQLERARDLELLDLRFFSERGLDGALRQRSGDFIVPARAHDRDAGATMGVLNPGRSLPRGRHLPQSSPRMQHALVNR